MKEILKTTVSLKEKQAFEAQAQREGKSSAAALRDVALIYSIGPDPKNQPSSRSKTPDFETLSDVKAARYFADSLDDFRRDIAKLKRSIEDVAPVFKRGMDDSARQLAAIGSDLRANAPVIAKLDQMDKRVSGSLDKITAAVDQRLKSHRANDAIIRANASAEIADLKTMIMQRFGLGWTFLTPAIGGALAGVLFLALLPGDGYFARSISAMILGERNNRFAAAGTLLGDGDSHQTVLFAQTAAALSSSTFRAQYGACLTRARAIRKGSASCTLDLPALGVR
jgi:hypothetical protein